MNLPLQSITRVPVSRIFGPMRSMRSPSMMIDVFVEGWRTSLRLGSMSVPSTSAIFSAGADNGKIDNARPAKNFALLFMSVESDLAFWFLRWRHYFTDGIEAD